MAVRDLTPPVATTAIALAIVIAIPAAASGEATGLTMRVADPPPVSFDATALGRATHPLRVVISNQGTRTLAPSPLAFRFRPVRDGVAYTCDLPQGKDDRWPKALDPGTSFTLDRDVTCETPLPGRYDMEIRARARGGSESDETTYGSFTLTIEPGANPPVRVPWETSLYAAASGTKEQRPTSDPNAAKIVVALINGTRAPVSLTPQKVILRVARRGSRTPPCAERTVDLPFAGTLAAGRSQTQTTALSCDISAEAIYDVDVVLANASGARARLATHAIRVGVLPPPPPRPEEAPTGRILGGM